MFNGHPFARRTNASTGCSSSSSVPTRTVVASAPSGILYLTSDSCFPPPPSTVGGSGANETSCFCSRLSSVVNGSCTHRHTVCRAVTNFSSRRGIVKSSRGTKKVWCYCGGGGGEGGWGVTVEVKG